MSFEGNNEKVFGERIEGVDYYHRVAVYGIAKNSKGRVATIRTPNGYFLPGGGIEKGETHEQCLHREFIEETGYKIAIGDYIGGADLYHKSKKGKHIYGIGHFYCVELEEKIAEKIEEDYELVWLESKECVNKLFLEHQAWAVSRVLL